MLTEKFKKLQWTLGIKTRDFKDLLKKNKSIKSFLSHKEIDKIFELEYHFKNINHIFKKINK